MSGALVLKLVAAQALTELQRQQMSWAIELYGESEARELTDLFTVHDESGAHVYDMHLFCDDDGTVHEAGTLNRVASFSQGGATGTDDEDLIERLNQALTVFEESSARS